MLKILSKFIHVLFKSRLRIYQHRQTKTDQHCNTVALKQLPGMTRCFTVKRNSVYLLFCIRCVTSNVRCWLFWVTAEQSTYLSQFSVFFNAVMQISIKLKLSKHSWTKLLKANEHMRWPFSFRMISTFQRRATHSRTWHEASSAGVMMLHS